MERSEHTVDTTSRETAIEEKIFSTLTLVGINFFSSDFTEFLPLVFTFLKGWVKLVDLERTCVIVA